MQQELTQSKCVACRADEPTVTSEDLLQLQLRVIDWSTVERNDVKRLERVFKFKDFAEALAFTNKVGQIAEEEGHHPSILTEWGRVTVTWWTHKIKGLHRNYFIMAVKTDRLLTPS